MSDDNRKSGVEWFSGQGFRAVPVQVRKWGAAENRTSQEPTKRTEIADGTESGNVSGSGAWTEDLLAAEEPLEIRVQFGTSPRRQLRSVAVTMRTPGEDLELAAGFLFTEGLICSPAEVVAIRHCHSGQQSSANVVKVTLKEGCDVRLEGTERHFYTTSSCGICGKASLAALDHRGLKPLASSQSWVPPSWVADLPNRLRAAQRVFEQTGGLHASGLFHANGDLELLREDIGRHNALDKLIGRKFLEGACPLNQYVLLLSGRVSFELVQKAIVAEIPMIVAIGAPSSLAVSTAEKYGVTLVGFNSRQRFNCYCHAERLNWAMS